MAVRKLDRDQSEGGDSERAQELDRVRQEAAGCRACPLWEIGTQTVFGAGPADARLMFIGEAPGQHEDKEGIPFVGPAGRLFDQALAQAEIPRPEVYVSNIVKHRPWVEVNGRPKNRAPKQSEIKACRPWLQHELRLVAPQMVVCVGAPAAKQILGKDFRLMEHRGQWFSTEAIPYVMAVVHPAFVLIQTEDSFDRWRSTLFADFRLIRERYRSL
jgi:uracil-DNA glycosylase